MKNLLGTIFFAFLLCSIIACSSLDTSTKKGTAYGAAGGAAGGALLGQAIGGDTSATLWGAAIGALIGGVAGHQIGSYMDAQETELNRAAARSPRNTVSVKRQEDVLIASFKSDELFVENSATLKPTAKSEIDQVAGVLRAYPETLIKVEGHTDKTGGEVANRELSKKQAKSVREALIESNVKAERIVALGLGDSKPASTVSSINRRINIVIIPSSPCSAIYPCSIYIEQVRRSRYRGCGV